MVSVDSERHTTRRKIPHRERHEQQPTGNNTGEKPKPERKERTRKDVYDTASTCSSESTSGNGAKVVSSPSASADMPNSSCKTHYWPQ